MDKIEKEIWKCYSQMKVEMATPSPFGSSFWDANSQYGYCLMDKLPTKKSAEEFVIKYYKKYIKLIRQ